MKLTTIIVTIFIIFNSILSLYAGKKEIKVNSIGDEALKFNLQDVSDTRVKFEDIFKDAEVVLLNFFSIYCIPCKEEIPLLSKISDEYKSKGLKIYLIDEGDSAELVKKYIDDTKLKLPVLLDTYRIVGARYSIDELPVTYIINKDKIVIKKITGKIGNKEDVLDSAILRKFKK